MSQTSMEQALGTAPTIQYRGRLLLTRPWGTEDLALMKSHLRDVIPDPMKGLATVLEGLHVDVQKAVAMQAYEDRKQIGNLSTRAAKEYYMTSEGMAFMLWLSVRHDQPDVTYEDLVSWVKDKMTEYAMECLEKLQAASGFGDDDPETILKKSGGSRSAANRTSRQPTKKKMKKSIGNTSRGPLPSDTHGRRRRFLEGSHIHKS